jgi:hypothetical protein
MKIQASGQLNVPAGMKNKASMSAIPTAALSKRMALDRKPLCVISILPDLARKEE